MFNPPEEMHACFEEALGVVKAMLGNEYGMFINGKDHFSPEKFEDRSPVDKDLVLGIFQKGNEADAQLGLASARKAFPAWSRTPWQERVSLLRKAADLIDERLYTISAVLALEVGKNRMESLGDVSESADLIRYSCLQMERNNGFITPLGNDPLEAYLSTNTTVMHPYGVWLVISPFNFPPSLSFGPSGAALVTGNTVMLKCSSDAPYTVRLMAECLRDAGIPQGVFNFGTGPGSSFGQMLIESPEVDGVTFTGSSEVGMKLYRDFAKYKYVRPVILELGGKNPTIVSQQGDIERAALGIMRSAFGLQGQKCSACSRVYAEEAVYEALAKRVVELTSQLVVGDPTERAVYMGPVINQKAYDDYQDYSAELKRAGNVLIGGNTLTGDKYKRGYYCAPTVVVNVPGEHMLWQQEMFLPIVMIAKVPDLAEGIRRANDVSYGLTAGFYGSKEEVEWFFDNIQAGVAYTNRHLGATTGAWPGFQPFGGWKGSGATGKNAGGLYYLLSYLHEQSQNRFE